MRHSNFYLKNQRHQKSNQAFLSCDVAMSDSNKASAPPGATAHDETMSTANDDQAALIEQSTSPLTRAPKRIAAAQTVCNERNAKGKPCHGFLKQMHTGGQMSQEHLRGEDVPYKCQTCGTVYTGAPQGHLRDPEKQTRYIEKELAAILRAAGGTLPAFERPQKAALPSSPEAKTPTSTFALSLASTNDSHTSKAQPSIGGAPVNETLAERNALFLAAEAARPQPYTRRKSKLFSRTTPTAHSTSGQDSSAEADAHRPAAEAQAATGFASAAPLSPSAATASPVSGAETIADLAPDASTEQANDA